MAAQGEKDVARDPKTTSLAVWDVKFWRILKSETASFVKQTWQLFQLIE